MCLDVEKAFDSIWHYGLIYKHEKFGYPVYLQKLIKSFLNEPLFLVCIDNVSSNKRKMQSGVPQGFVLPLMLYSIYISDFKLRNNYITVLYADDTALITSGKVSNAITKNLERILYFTKKYFDK